MSLWLFSSGDGPTGRLPVWTRDPGWTSAGQFDLGDAAVRREAAVRLDAVRPAPAARSLARMDVQGSRVVTAIEPPRR